MNISELSRKLKITSNQLYDLFPQIGIDVGRRAIKIDDKVAHKILKNWSEYRLLLFKKPAEEEKKDDAPEAEKPSVSIPSVITVRDFAVLLNLPVTKLLATLMNNGILTALNEKIDYETASIIAEDLGYRPRHQTTQEADNTLAPSDTIKDVLDREDQSTLVPRPPVVVVMGHVDHGKTSILDAIRKTNVIAGEAGGITQHIGAYQIVRKIDSTGEDRLITFIDTPGHEAFTTMRSRGAKIADIAILVVAADDGIKPQTTEAIKIIRAAALPLVVAINKIDKNGADIDRVKRELSDTGLIPEDWGGSTVCVPISAKQHIGIDDLLDVLLIVADMEKDNRVANPAGACVATVIESHIDKNEGPVATILVQNGTLRQNDFLLLDSTLYGKVRHMRDAQGKSVAQALPSQPVKIIGFKRAPVIGDMVSARQVLGSDVVRMEKSRGHGAGSSVITAPKLSEKEQKRPSVNLVLKTDTLGSLEAIAASLQKIEHPEVKIKIISKELGAITTADVLRAEATHAMIAGFQVSLPVQVADIASEKKVEIILYRIIYELLDDVRERVEKLIAPEVQRTTVGQARVLKVFRSDEKTTILGAVVQTGNFEKGARATVLRNGEPIGDGIIASIQSGKIEIPSAQSGQECGMLFEGKIGIAEQDTLEAFTEKKIKRTLENDV
ncbi:translation initiation factor IF-2 [Candidatus Uhrbacteria bacterium]|nr:translation initiation factor IF-2 [Candidatus Uhrbacteria bacterium]